MSTHHELTRRVFLGAVAAAPLASAQQEWIPLFDGRSLNGWKPSENKGSWTVRDGVLAGNGGRSHLFYDGAVRGADFRNFELELECNAAPAANSGVYFHTRYQERDFPYKGFEIQICNSVTGKESYQPRVMTGSLYGIRNIYKAYSADEQWTKVNVLVRGKNIQIRVNGMLLIDYVEPTPPFIPNAPEKERCLDRGTFALQCHDEHSPIRYRNVRVRPLPDDTPTPDGAASEADETFRDVIEIGRHNIPMVDFHVHLKRDLSLEQAVARSRRDGIQYGIAVNAGRDNTAKNDADLQVFIDKLKGAPVFTAMQAEGREWTQMFSRRVAAQFDYIFTDSMTWTDNRGKRMRLWIPGEVGTITDAQEFMDTLVDRTVGILNNEPVDIYVNPTFLPDVLAKDYETLWTEARRRSVIEAAVRNEVAIELNNRYRLPSVSFVKMAKAAGAKFTFGTNNEGSKDLRRCEYGIEIVKECKLGWKDFFVPLKAPKAIERKPAALRA